MARSMVAKFEKYWSDIPGVMAVAAVLDPRYKMLDPSMVAKFEKYWNDISGVMAMAAILDPRYKMLWVEFHFGRLYGFDADRQRDKVYGLLNELITEYESNALLMGVELVEEFSSFDYSIEVLGGDE